MDHKTQKKKLIDGHGRILRKLRVQLTDACNFRCFYCMPQDAKFMSSEHLLSPVELVNICSILVDMGIEEIRVSGGEPTLRKEFDEIVQGLSALPVGKLGMTSNGFLLQSKLDFLKQTACRHINISLDTLKKDRFYALTRTHHFDAVYGAIIQAKEMDFHVKVNMVVMAGLNDDEIFDFIAFSARKKIEVRFLELMKIGPYYRQHDRLFVPVREMIKKIESQEKLSAQSVSCDSTSFNFITASGGQIGFIASESLPFCNSCSRLRLTANGTLRACLMSEAGVNLRGRPACEYPSLLKSVMAMKPTERLDHIEQPMYQIGG